MVEKQSIYVGTSGWSYPHWKGPFYPEDLPNDKMLSYYIRYFSSVEINNSFYRLPKKSVLEHWRASVPHRFIFSAKVSRYITHMKKLKDCAKSLRTFLRLMSVLQNNLGPVLFQLPPHWHFNPQRLSELLRTLSGDFKYAFEFRDRSWLNEQTYALLSRYNAANCIFELNGYISPNLTTADFVYVRLHGPAGAYLGCYNGGTLAHWAKLCKDWSGEKRKVYCYFDNDESAYATRNALTLQSMLQ